MIVMPGIRLAFIFSTEENRDMLFLCGRTRRGERLQRVLHAQPAGHCFEQMLSGGRPLVEYVGRHVARVKPKHVVETTFVKKRP